MRKSELILNELAALAHDINEVVEREQDENTAWMKTVQEAQKKNQPLPGRIADPKPLQAELAYFVGRLNSVRSYLGYHELVL